MAGPDPPTPAAQPPGTPAGTLERLPRRLGPCELVEPLGAGGMGIVYLARMVEPRPYAAAGTRVAVKVLHTHRLRGAVAIERLRREVELGTALDDPAVVRTFEAQTTMAADGRLQAFLVLEYVEGRTLDKLLAELGALPEALVRHLGAAVAGALAAIHKAGALHRDVKPQNVLITPDHRVKLTDFGIAHLIAPAESLTGSDSFVGSLYYAAPEQFVGTALGPGADLHSLGVILFEAATGKHPFAARTLAELVRERLEHVPPKAGSLSPRLTPFLEEVIGRLLEKDPPSRFGSAAEVVRVLEEGEASAWWRERERELRAHDPAGSIRRARVGHDTELVGRGSELERLRRAFEAAAAGAGRLVLIEGEAGVGKSRLVEELLRELERSGEATYRLHGASSPVPFAAARGAIHAAVLTHLGSDGLRAGLGRYLPGVEAALVQRFGDLLAGGATGGGEPLGRDLVQALFCQLARGLAAERPTVWVIEDLHCAGADTVEILLALARIVAAERLLLVATTRPGLPDGAARFALERLEATERLGLGRLTGRHVVELVQEVLASDSLAERLAPAIAERSDGNPFFVLAIARQVRDGAAGPHDPARLNTLDGLSREIPGTVRDLLAARLAQLHGGERAMLEVAAVQGGAGFDADLVARVLGRERLEVFETLAAIERRTGLVRARGAGFSFDHHLLQEVLYSGLGLPLRAALHGRLAGAIAARDGVDLELPATLSGEAALVLAGHLLRGGDWSRGLRLAPRALDHLSQAGKGEAAVELARLALAAEVAVDPALETRLRLAETRGLAQLGRHDEQLSAIEAAMAAAETAADDVLRVRAFQAFGSYQMNAGDYRGASDTLARALDLADRCGAAGEALQVRGALATALHNLGRVAEACTLAEGVLARARDPLERANALVDLAVIVTEIEPARARGGYREALALAAEHGVWQVELVAANNLGLLDLYSGELDSARAWLERAQTRARELASRRYEAAASGNLALIARDRGVYGEAGPPLEAALALSREIGDRRTEALSLGNLGTVRLEEGRLEEAAERLRACLTLSRALGLTFLEWHVLLRLGDLARARGDRAAAASQYRRALEGSREGGRWGTAAEAALALGRLQVEGGGAAVAGDEAAAVDLLEEAMALTSEHGLAEPGPLPSAYLARLGRKDPAAVAIGDGSPVLIRAEAHLVLHQAGASGDHLEQARALLARASSHLDGPELAAFWRANPVASASRAAG